MLVNGVLSDSISAADRGLLYGDGVFRTLRVMAGRPQHWERHYRKLRQDCSVLNLSCPKSDLLLEELQRLSEQQPDGVAKIIITRGQSARGYAPPADAILTRILSLSPTPEYPEHFSTHGVRLRVCELRLAHQPRLAGIKHLNRLENVLAASESNDAEIAEGVLLDTSCNVIECIRNNLFLFDKGELFTADLSRCGVAGVQRDRVMEWAAGQNMPCHIKQFGLPELFAAEEVFLVNSVIGLWPVRELQDRIWARHPVAMQIQEWLNHAAD